jgi:hypothetical protein
MIICRRPFKLYDVDLIGIAALAVVGLAACFGVILPASADATECRILSDRIAAADGETETTNGRLRQVNAEIGVLQSGVAERVRTAPKADALTPFLQRVANLAEYCDVQITEVLPHPVRKVDGCLIGDVWFAGRGASLDFIRLLDELAREAPYNALRDFSIAQAGGPDDARCRLSWTLRLHMLEEAPPGPAAGTP